MSENMPWRDAVIDVLTQSEKPLHYSEIAQVIIDNKYRVDVGATPAVSVASTLSDSLRKEKRHSPFARVERGVYTIAGRSLAASESPVAGTGNEAEEDAQEMGLINAFGMFWSRDRISWKTNRPKLLGLQQSGSAIVDFASQKGVYVLYDGSRVIYVGRVTESRMGQRLFEHTRDRFEGRWDRFSWFGVKRVGHAGELIEPPSSGIAVFSLISTMEALLIEGLEPPQNRRQGDGFNAVEFIQETDPEIHHARDREALDRLRRQSVPGA